MRRIAFLVAIACCGGSVFAGEFIVPLPGLHGIYTQGTWRTMTFHAGRSFTAIRSVRLELAGTHQLGWFGGVECSVHQAPLSYRAALGPGSSTSSCCWQTGNMLGEYWLDFYDNAPLLYPSYPWCPPGTLDFLLDGSDELTLSFTHGANFCTLLLSGSARVESACLIIDGDAPGVHLFSPLAGKMLQAGSVVPIQWSDFQDPACQGDYLLEYSVDDGQTWLPMAAVSQACSYAWELPAVTSAACFVKLTKDDGSGMDSVRGPFSIYPCQKTLAGDFLRDCYINLGDFAALASHWLAEPPCSAGVPGDMDGDCDVQLNDVLLFAENWLVCVNPLDERCQAD